MRGLYFRPRRAAGFRPYRLGGLCLAFALAVPVFPKDQAQVDMHIRLIRGLEREIAINKVALPRGKKGVRVDEHGKLDKADAENQLHSEGMAIKPGMPVEITRIIFKSSEIVFELNGGGKNHRPWYEHIEIGMPAEDTGPLSDTPPAMKYGSSVTVVYPDKVPDLTVEQAKATLGNVLDFSRHSPTDLYSPTVPPQFKDAIKNHQVIVGMDRDNVLSSKGPPDRKVREAQEGVEVENWIYGIPPHVLFITFDGDSVIKVQQF